MLILNKLLILCSLVGLALSIINLVQTSSILFKVIYLLGTVLSITALLLLHQLVFISLFIIIIYAGGILIFILFLFLFLRGVKVPLKLSLWTHNTVNYRFLIIISLITSYYLSNEYTRLAELLMGNLTIVALPSQGLYTYIIESLTIIPYNNYNLLSSILNMQVDRTANLQPYIKGFLDPCPVYKINDSLIMAVNCYTLVFTFVCELGDWLLLNLMFIPVKWFVAVNSLPNYFVKAPSNGGLLWAHYIITIGNYYFSSLLITFLNYWSSIYNYTGIIQGIDSGYVNDKLNFTLIKGAKYAIFYATTLTSVNLSSIAIIFFSWGSEVLITIGLGLLVGIIICNVLLRK